MINGAAIGKDKDRLWCILQDEKLFYMGGYKALTMASKQAGLARCMRSSDNGKIKLSYDISDYSALDEELSRLTVEDIIEVVKSLTRSVMTIRNNGMMSLQSTVFEMDKVFVSGSRSRGFKTLLIYLPLAVQSSIGGDDGSENYFRFLRELLRSAGRASVDPVLRPLSAALDKNKSSLEGFYEELNSFSISQSSASGSDSDSHPHFESDSDSHSDSGSGSGSDTKEKLQWKLNAKQTAILIAQLVTAAAAVLVFFLIGPIAIAAVLFADAIAVVIILTQIGKKPKEPETNAATVSVTPPGDDALLTEDFSDFTPTVRLVGQNTPMMLKFRVEKAEFTIGRSSSCDAIIPETLKSVSGHHCKLITENGLLYVADDYPGKDHVGSKNGTYINGSANRISPKQRAKLQINDTLQLANYRFKVERL